MTDFALFTMMAAAYIIVGLLRAAWRRRYCLPSEHLVTVVGTHRVRDGLGKRYWIRCRVCDLERGPYDTWQAAWQDVLRMQIAARRGAVSRERSPRPASSRITR
jgi:hypothetical protein